MREFTEAARYEYDLTDKSVVMDVGAHRGTFADEISRRYACTVLCYEPIRQFFEECAKRFKLADNIRVYHYGLGDHARIESFKIKGDMSGKFADAGPEELVTIVDITDELDDLNDAYVHLLKLNIEGGEYELLEAILNRGLATRFRDIQVQFHGCIPDAVQRRDAIRARLALTHELTYDAPFVWENWRIK